MPTKNAIESSDRTTLRTGPPAGSATIASAISATIAQSRASVLAAVTRARLGDLLDCVLAREPAFDLHLLPLEVLVDGEEVRDLVLQLLVDVLERFELVPVRIRARDCQHLVVDALVVLHPEERDRLDLDHAAGEGGFRHADHHVERIPVERQRVRDEAVVRRIHD